MAVSVIQLDCRSDRGFESESSVIPEFDEHGYLPPGIHAATLTEIDERFGRESELRRAEMQSLQWLIDLVRRAGGRRIVVNGSFVTEVFEPNDVDCVVLIDEGYPLDASADNELSEGLPFLQFEMLYQPDFDSMVNNVYGSDRQGVPKGVVEVIGWN